MKDILYSCQLNSFYKVFSRGCASDGALLPPVSPASRNTSPSFNQLLFSKTEKKKCCDVRSFYSADMTVEIRKITITVL